MAFIREYSMAGDPGIGSFFKKIGRGVKKVAGGAFKLGKKLSPFASFIPGLQPLALAGRLGKVGSLGMKAASLYGKGRRISDVTARYREALRRYQEEPEPEPEPEEDYDVEDFESIYRPRFRRAYYMLDDEAGDPGSRRKAAGSGPKQKAKKKQQTRAKKAAGVKRTGPEKRRPSGGSLGKKIGGALSSFDPSVLGDLGRIAGKSGLLGKGRRMTEFGIVPGGMGAGRRRRINPTNVKALKRAARRFEGFEKVVKTVRKSIGGAARAAGAGAARSGRRGHKRGCRCVACRAA